MTGDVPTETLPAELMRRALEHAGEGIALIDGGDPAHPIRWINEAFARLSGFSPAELLGSSLRVLQGADQEQPALASLRAAMDAGRECSVQLRSYRPDGALYRNELRVVPCAEEGGRVWWLVYARDVSPQHELEVALGRRADDLDATQRRLAEIDPIDRVTGLQSEQSFELALELAWFSCARDRRSLALFLFSPDDFDVYLDTFGRVAGDSCLRMVARGIGGAFRRASDVAARLGEAEFVALGTDMEPDMLEPHARRVCDRVRALAIRNPHAPKARILTVSAVVLAGRPGRAPDWRALLDDARASLAGARAAGAEQVLVRSSGDED
jgi:diguanylate cyclase (GGDEF)-like protein/PAS domain S-box-containing protein